MANEYHTVIDFDDHGIRTFATSIVQLTPSHTTAPDRPKRPRRRTTKTV
jgi:hypothetical protein